MQGKKYNILIGIYVYSLGLIYDGYVFFNVLLQLNFCIRQILNSKWFILEHYELFLFFFTLNLCCFVCKQVADGAMQILRD